MEKPLHKKYKIGVFGSAGGKDNEANKVAAFEIGWEIAIRDGIVLTGDCGGFPYEAARGASEAGGMTIGFSPAMNLAEHVEKHIFPDGPSIHIFTGMEKKGRNLICTRSCDAAIFISGRSGTMNEFTLVYDEGEGKVIGLLLGSGGAVDDYIIPFIDSTEKPSKSIIVRNVTPVALVGKVFAALDKLRHSKEEMLK